MLHRTGYGRESIPVLVRAKRWHPGFWLAMLRYWVGSPMTEAERGFLPTQASDSKETE